MGKVRDAKRSCVFWEEEEGWRRCPGDLQPWRPAKEEGLLTPLCPLLPPLQVGSRIFYLAWSRMGSGCRSELASFYYFSATETPQPSLGPPWTSTIHGSDTCFPFKTGLWKIHIWVTERNHYTSNKACDKYKILPKHCLAPFCPYLCKSAQSRAPL